MCLEREVIPAFLLQASNVAYRHTVSLNMPNNAIWRLVSK